MLQPLLVVTVAGSFFASGGYSSVATLPPFVQQFNTFWPLAYAFEMIQALLFDPIMPSLNNFLVGLVTGCVLAVGFGVWRMWKIL